MDRIGVVSGYGNRSIWSFDSRCFFDDFDIDSPDIDRFGIRSDDRYRVCSRSQFAGSGRPLVRDRIDGFVRSQARRRSVCGHRFHTIFRAEIGQHPTCNLRHRRAGWAWTLETASARNAFGDAERPSHIHRVTVSIYTIDEDARAMRNVVVVIDIVVVSASAIVKIDIAAAPIGPHPIRMPFAPFPDIPVTRAFPPRSPWIGIAEVAVAIVVEYPESDVPAGVGGLRKQSDRNDRDQCDDD